MVAKKVSKSKLKRQAKRAQKAAAAAEEVPESVDQEQQAISDTESVPEAVPLATTTAEEDSDASSENEQDNDENEEERNEQENDDEEHDEESSSETTARSNKKSKRPAINNTEALIRLTDKIKLKKLPWIETMSVTSSKPIEIPDIQDDMARELAFYQQALEGATIGRTKVLEAGVPFSRPDDYFAEMVKSDEHMAKIRQRLANEEARIKAAEDAKRQRQLKKLGKKIQVEKQLERQKQKAETLEKIKLLKKKRKSTGEDLTVEDDFDIALENADSSRKKQKTEHKKKPGPSKKRQMKNAKYGMGGRKRGKKSNTAESSAELGNYYKVKSKPKVPFGKK